MRSRSCGLGQFWSLGSLATLNQMGVLRDKIGLSKKTNWMHDNHSTHWAQALPFIQWRCNTQSHRGIGRTPYHLMFGKHPLVGISNLPIDPNLLSSLATEMDFCHSLGLWNMPLECVNLVSSLGAVSPLKILYRKSILQKRQRRQWFFCFKTVSRFIQEKDQWEEEATSQGGWR